MTVFRKEYYLDPSLNADNVRRMEKEQIHVESEALSCKPCIHYPEWLEVLPNQFMEGKCPLESMIKNCRFPFGREDCPYWVEKK